MSIPPDKPVLSLLRYRPWKGRFRTPFAASEAIARVSLGIMFRRRLFWALYALSIVIFLFFFYGQYLQVWLEQKLTDETIRVGGLFPRNVRPDAILKALRTALQLNGSAETYANFIWFEGYIAVVILALVGSVIVGNDFHHNSLPFYFSKPLARRHYVLGKCMAIAAFVNLMTTIPAVVLFFEYGFIESWQYWFDEIRLLGGILIYGSVLTVSLSLLLMATATMVRRTVPLVMVWTTMFVLARLIQRWLVDGLRMSERWRLIDLWNDMYLVGQWAMGTAHDQLRPRSQIQPAFAEAAVAVALVVVGCLVYLRRKLRNIDVMN